mmetsp:Transcript_10565/g.26012  ORF Transcript_10565/g.26012 Transcript_10565/m.26012 type:complete len:209 (+) Transcript_10565:318-944(+)
MPKHEIILRHLSSSGDNDLSLDTIRLATLSGVLRLSISNFAQSNRRFNGLYAIVESETSELRSWTRNKAWPCVRLCTASASPMTNRLGSLSSDEIISTTSSSERVESSIAVTWALPSASRFTKHVRNDIRSLDTSSPSRCIPTKTRRRRSCRCPLVQLSTSLIKLRIDLSAHCKSSSTRNIFLSSPSTEMRSSDSKKTSCQWVEGSGE